MQRAIEKLGILGGGFKIVPVGARVMVVSVPYELNTDHATVLAQAESRGWEACGGLRLGFGATLIRLSRVRRFVTKSELQRTNNWPSSRIDRVLGSMLKAGMAWVDDQAGHERQFWFPSVWSSRHMMAEPAVAVAT